MVQKRKKQAQMPQPVVKPLVLLLMAQVSTITITQQAAAVIRLILQAIQQAAIRHRIPKHQIIVHKIKIVVIHPIQRLIPLQIQAMPLLQVVLLVKVIVLLLSGLGRFFIIERSLS